MHDNEGKQWVYGIYGSVDDIPLFIHSFTATSHFMGASHDTRISRRSQLSA